MKLTSVTGQGSFEFDIERFVQGIELTNIRSDSTIKIDMVDDNLNDINVIPLMSVGQLHTIMQKVDKNRIVGNFTTVTSHFDSVKVLFSLQGVIPLTEQRKLRVTLGNLNKRSVVINAIDNDSERLGSLIRIEKSIIKETQPQFDVNLTGVSQLYFEDAVLDKITLLKNISLGGKNQTRKVEFSKEQFAFKSVNSSVMNAVDKAKSYSEFDGTTWDASNLKACTLHYEEELDLFFYKIYNAQ